eukprot:CAMPEP_0119369018 /NCGR_PEP_ID=MMETSP1334-20130426/15607_1 /TAXON_ID=127549 /ORGANISM="Calcidiscus leptoporus, Strain RCC1130" /LENGTH=52 /DNA_ID=CAMNT_0007385783 /DNA_START=408 /DNA_END=562 /DNA_ORIENTATION=+
MHGARGIRARASFRTKSRKGESPESDWTHRSEWRAQALSSPGTVGASPPAAA